MGLVALFASLFWRVCSILEISLIIEMLKREIKTLSFLNVHTFSEDQFVRYLEDAKVKYKLCHMKRELDK